MARLIICSAAETDYTESLVWYAGRSLEAANDFENEFDRRSIRFTQILDAFRRVTHATVFSSCGGSLSA